VFPRLWNSTLFLQTSSIFWNFYFSNMHKMLAIAIVLIYCALHQLLLMQTDEVEK